MLSNSVQAFNDKVATSPTLQTNPHLSLWTEREI